MRTWRLPGQRWCHHDVSTCWEPIRMSVADRWTESLPSGDLRGSNGVSQGLQRWRTEEGGEGEGGEGGGEMRRGGGAGGEVSQPPASSVMRSRLDQKRTDRWRKRWVKRTKSREHTWYLNTGGNGGRNHFNKTGGKHEADKRAESEKHHIWRGDCRRFYLMQRLPEALLCPLLHLLLLKTLFIMYKIILFFPF